jgi:hypothetical protein
MKAKTPMSIMKAEIDKLKEFPLLSFFGLNGRPKNFIALGSEDNREVIVVNPVTFDYMAVYGILGEVCHNEKGHVRHTRSMALCFNYKTEETVRASVVLSKEGQVEYSKEYTVPEFKILLKDFVDQNKECPDSYTLMENFISTFGIVVSSTFSRSEINQIKIAYVKQVTGLRDVIRNADKKKVTINQNIRDAKTEEEKTMYIQRLNDLKEMVKTANADMVRIVKHDFKNMPADARKYFFESLKKEMICY